MPDITLYRDDVVRLRDVVLCKRRALCEVALKRVLRDEEYDEMLQLDRLADVLLDRLVQLLHPRRTKIA